MAERIWTWRLERWAEVKGWPHFCRYSDANEGKPTQEWGRAPLRYSVFSAIESLAARASKLWPHRHYVLDDQCLRPDHRFCLYCRRLTPDAEVSH